MEFIRINENTVRCIVTEEDMKEYDVQIDDFLKNGSNVQEFLHTIVEKASDEVGYEPKDGMLAMQIMMLPKNRLAITFSEKSDNTSDINELIKQVAGATVEKVASLKELFEEEKGEKEEDAVERKKAGRKRSVMPNAKIFEFNCLQDFESLCGVISDKFTVKSSLYKDDVKNIFYVIFEKGRLSKVNFELVCRTASEYGRFISDKQENKAYVEEHFDCLIAAKAVKIIRDMQRVDF